MSTVFQRTLEVRTSGQGFVDITAEVAGIVAEAGKKTGLCTVFLQHTSASLVIQENADPAVLRDLQRWMTRLAPEGSGYEHDEEGPDDMPGHLRSAITRSSEVIPIVGGRLGLGRWQALYLWEHRRAAHVRRLVVTVLGTG
ncbi:secondary thiamine-phosphate synthase enzyme YjbQ [Chondromyces apiculatus]|uniref:secondary thiamine-phosphate synthase enzyme YjbQ n=1 Tax=Chondromyces apiculatus TaxID=51 RepID=UPI0005C5596D